MKVLVVGAAGKVGQMLLQQLQADGTYEVVGMVRKSEQVERVKEYAATPMLKDLTSDLNGSCKGIDAVIFVAGSGGKDVENVDYLGVKKMVAEAEQQKVKRFLFIGSLNMGKTPEQFIQEAKDYYQKHNQEVPGGLAKAAKSEGYQHYLSMKTKAEAVITDSNLNYTILRAGLLTDETKLSPVTYHLGQYNKFGKTSRINIAQAFVDSISDSSKECKIYSVINTE